MFHSLASASLREIKINAKLAPVLIWPVLAATAAAVVLLIVYWFGFSDLDHLVPDGTNFLPYYTT
jgi:hypothetical protein